MGGPRGLLEKGANVEPIREFQNIAEARVCLKEWQARLFLSDWTIKIRLVERDEIPGDNGRNDFQVINQSATIRLAIPSDDYKDRIQKFCHEKTLVHELLHCKFNWVVCLDTYEGKYVDEMEHQLLAQMAKSLIMAKYGITADWFSNITY